MGKLMLNGISYTGGEGGSGSSNCVTLTQAQYNDLSQAEKNNGTYYYISDADVDASSTGLIDDTSTPSPDKVWSSEKTSQEIASAVGVTIDDTTTAVDKVWSSDKTDSEIGDLDTNLTNRFLPYPTGSGPFYSGIGGFNPNSEYYLGDLVSFHHKQWKCIQAITNPPIDYANDWDLYFEEYSVGTMITDFIAPWYQYVSGGGIHTVYYKVGQLVIFRGQLYRCIADTNSDGWDETKWEHVDVEKLTKIDKDYIFTVDSSYENITTVNSFKMRVISGILYVYFDLSFSGTGFTGGVIGNITRTDNNQDLDIGTDIIYISTPIGEDTSIGAMSESVISSIEPMGISSHTYAYLNIDCYTEQAAPIKRVIGNLVYPLG